MPSPNQPVSRAPRPGNIDTGGRRQVRIEVAAKKRTAGRPRGLPETHDVVEAIVKIVGGYFESVAIEFLIQARTPILAGFLLQVRIFCVAHIGAVRLIIQLVLDSL